MYSVQYSAHCSVQYIVQYIAQYMVQYIVEYIVLYIVQYIVQYIAGQCPSIVQFIVAVFEQTSVVFASLGLASNSNFFTRIVPGVNVIGKDELAVGAQTLAEATPHGHVSRVWRREASSSQ